MLDTRPHQTYRRALYGRNAAKYRAKTARWRANNPDKVAALNKVKRAPEARRLRNVRHLYGLTPEQYHALLGEQNGLCKICHRTNDGMALCVDHEHVPGYAELPAEQKAKLVRGLLCHHCNAFVGMCGDQVVEVARRAQALLDNVNAYMNRISIST